MKKKINSFSSRFQESEKPINVNISSVYSIRNVFLSKEKNNKIDIAEKNMNNMFTLSDIQNYYFKFINNLLDKNIIHLPFFNSIKNIKFINMNLDYLINLEVHSNIMLCNFKEIEEDFLKKLRIIVKNSHVKFNFIIKNIEYKIFLTREDILKKMITKNPLVLKLKNELGLVM